MRINKVIFSLLILISVSFSAMAQSYNKLANANVSALGEEQIAKLVSEMNARNASIEDVKNEALRNGMPLSEWTKLEARIEAARGKEESPSSVAVDDTRKIEGEIYSKPKSQAEERVEDNARKSIVFGSSLFNREKLTFEPNLQLPTPENYQLGPGDVILIDVTGLAENSYRLDVSPEGNIRIPKVGLVQLSGLTIEQARKTIKKHLSNVYESIKTDETHINITLGNIRGIKVLMIGEVFMPGVYTLPSVASIYNALNVAGGPNSIGSFRDIKLIRNNVVIARLDVYDFLMTGILKNNHILQDQDIIKVEPYQKRVSLFGEAKNTGIFEVTENETLNDLLTYAGGFTDKAYKEQLTVFRNTDKERSVATVKRNEFSEFKLQNGDQFNVGVILNRFANRVQIEGAVFRPGTYALEDGMTLRTLIERADGVSEDAFMNRAVLTRLNEDKSKEVISFSVEDLINGKVEDIKLQKEDIVRIAFAQDMLDNTTVSIWGEVKNEGVFDYSGNMTLKDLIFIAGGVNYIAETAEVEISRLITEPDELKSNPKRITTFYKSLDKELAVDGDEFLLEPFDQVVIRRISGLEEIKKATIEGEVFYPGTYIITNKKERISDLVVRAGGLNSFAYSDGAFLLRDRKKSKAEEELGENLTQNILIGDDEIIDKHLFLDRSGIVSIDLKKIIEKPGSKWDLFLEEGDILNVPKQLQTVQVSGEVFSPIHVGYHSGKSFKYYINNCGGFSNNAIKRKAFIVYANGSAVATKNYVLFKKYPKVKPGAHIYVPTKPERQSMSAGEAIGITSSVTTLATVLLSLFL